MNFAIAVTPAQFLYGIIGLLLFFVGFVALDKLAVETTPEEQKYGMRVAPVVINYVNLRDKVSELSVKNDEAVVKAELPVVEITPNDWRVKGRGEFTIKNVTDVNVKGVRFTIILKSQSLDANILQLVPIKYFDTSLKPNEVASFELNFSSFALSSFKHPRHRQYRTTSTWPNKNS